VSEAFFCDFCLEYHDGEPEEQLYRKEHIDRQGTDVIHVADLCGECAQEVLPSDE